MKILIADSDRDFLSSFKRLMELSENEVTTVFDGTQIITKTTNHNFDIVILNRSIPRINSRNIVDMLNKDNIPVIVLLGCKINSDILLDEILANAHLSFPFFPDELTELIEEVYQKARSKEKIVYSDIEIDVSEFKLCGEVRVTNEEINVLRSLVSGTEFNIKRTEPFINSLNNKFEKLSKKLRIKYLIGEGYKLVTDNE